VTSDGGFRKTSPPHPAATRPRPDGSSSRGKTSTAYSPTSDHTAFPANPANYGRAVTLTFDQFRYGWANAVSADEAKQLHDTFHVAAPGAPLFQAATANFNPRTEAKVDHKNPQRGPLLPTSGGKDHTVPWAITNASFKKQRHNTGVTEIVEVPNRGHALTIDSGWREVADTALAFVKRFVQGQATPPA